MVQQGGAYEKKVNSPRINRWPSGKNLFFTTSCRTPGFPVYTLSTAGNTGFFNSLNLFPQQFRLNRSYSYLAPARSCHTFLPKFTLNNHILISVKKVTLFIFALSLGLSLWAQDSTSTRNAASADNSRKSDRKSEKRQRINAMIKSEEEGNLSYRKQKVVGLELRTNGYGAFYEMGIRRSPRYTTIYSLELSEIKHRKEDKVGGAENFFSNSFVYGKLNNFYQAKLGFGQQYILGQKGNKNGVAVTASLSGGLSMGLLKPYYLQVVDSVGKERSVSYDMDSTAFLDPSSIIGGAGFTKGWNRLKVKPGVFVKAALRFDFGRYNERVQALEIGMSVDAYAQKIPIMALNEPRQLFYQGHIAFIFGSRKK